MKIDRTETMKGQDVIDYIISELRAGGATLAVQWCEYKGERYISDGIELQFADRIEYIDCTTEEAEALVSGFNIQDIGDAGPPGYRYYGYRWTRLY